VDHARAEPDQARRWGRSRGVRARELAAMLKQLLIITPGGLVLYKKEFERMVAKVPVGATVPRPTCTR